MNLTILGILTTLLGGTNILTLLGYFTERKKRVHEANVKKYEAVIKESDALDKMRETYTIFVGDMNIAMQHLRSEKDELKKELDNIRIESRSIQKKLNNAYKNCNKNCFIDEK